VDGRKGKKEENGETKRKENKKETIGNRKAEKEYG
jgi:hypothetical protein